MKAHCIREHKDLLRRTEEAERIKKGGFGELSEYEKVLLESD